MHFRFALPALGAVACLLAVPAVAGPTPQKPSTTVVKKLLTGAERRLPMMVNGNYSYEVQNHYGPNYAMIGDAPTDDVLEPAREIDRRALKCVAPKDLAHGIRLVAPPHRQPNERVLP